MKLCFIIIRMLCLALLTGDCLARYWCMNGSSTSTPNDGVTGQLCPAGSYCSQGTPVPTACPLGKKFSIDFDESRLKRNVLLVIR